jgi:beta-galactosidase
MSFKSGFCNENSTVRWTMAPGPLREAAGFSYQEFTNLKEPLPLAGDPYGTGEENRVSVWAEYLIPDKAIALAYYDHPVFGRYPAITRNSFGKGALTYEGTMLSDRLQEKVVLDTLEISGVSLCDASLPAPVKTRHAILQGEKPVHFYFNFSGQTQEFLYNYGTGTEMLSGREVGASGKMALPAWGAALIKEK